MCLTQHDQPVVQYYSDVEKLHECSLPLTLEPRDRQTDRLTDRRTDGHREHR